MVRWLTTVLVAVAAAGATTTPTVVAATPDAAAAASAGVAAAVPAAATRRVCRRAALRRGGPPPIAAAFKGHLFGSSSAHDEAASMGLDAAGNLYLAGTTTPRDAGGGGGGGWGSLLPGHTGGGADLWVAKLSPTTRLLWVRRAGSAAPEEASALAVGRTGVVVCGTTGGDMRAGRTGGRVVGAADGGGGAADNGAGGGRIVGAEERGPGAVSAAEEHGGGGNSGGGGGGGVRGGADDGTAASSASRGWGPLGGGSGGTLPTHPQLLAAAVDGSAGGGTDAVLVKLLPDGTEAWSTPLQFGGAGVDTCAGVAMDADAGWVWAAGATASALFGRTAGAAAFGAPQPPVGRSDYWVAKAAGPGLLPELVAGVQRGAERSNSADAVALAGNHLYVVVNTYDGARGAGGGVAMLHTYAADSLALLASTAAPAPRGGLGVAAADAPGLYLSALIVDGGGNPIVGGFAGDAQAGVGRFVVAKYHAAAAGWAWSRPHGRYSRVEPTVSLAVDPHSGAVYVGGLTDGFYTDAASAAAGGGGGADGVRGRGAPRGRIVVPLVQVNASTGLPTRRWHKTTAVPGGGERTRAIGVDAAGAVVTAGSRLSGGSPALRKAHLGAFGSSAYATRVAGGFASAGDGDGVAVDSSTGSADAPPATMPLRAVMGMVAGVIGGAIVLVGAMIAGVQRRSGAGRAAASERGGEGGTQRRGGGGGRGARVGGSVDGGGVGVPGGGDRGGSAGPV
ncbi:hypothetical protein BU14_0027s0078 [Porphyra umbilicalis]|uniref:Uncharacterized protein n=1 Tax=Porphyra umbilicalis TaxID=2786 RepID=A0A1X6PJK3_PORUM|nr:hypothetical protein BU14_0027s0078 [Porphyra umbilicalis]|eukprot:OSX81052.1 hypothetical protein BU14_0027s0078 [Porphyra umbilicalis]